MVTWHVAVRDPGSAHWSHTSTVIPQYEVRNGWCLWWIPWPVQYLRRPKSSEKSAKKRMKTLVKSLRVEFDVLVTEEKTTPDGVENQSSYFPKNDE